MTVVLQPVMKALPADRPEIEALMDEAFGANRHEKTAYRLRDGNAPLENLGLVVRGDDRHLCGSIEFWPIEIVDELTGVAAPAVLLGPIAVAKSCRGQGLGGTLIRAGVAAAQQAGHDTIVLVGDPEYYGRFGFSDEATKGWALPGPYEQRRLLAITKDTVPAKAKLRGLSAFGKPDQERKACA